MSSGKEKRKCPVHIRVDEEAYARLVQERDARHCKTFNALIHELLPTDQQKTGRCRYCERTMRQPDVRHRYHAAECALWDDKDYPVYRKAS